jgi:hypothetical protein
MSAPYRQGPDISPPPRPARRWHPAACFALGALAQAAVLAFVHLAAPVVRGGRAYGVEEFRRALPHGAHLSVHGELVPQSVAVAKPCDGRFLLREGGSLLPVVETNCAILPLVGGRDGARARTAGPMELTVTGTLDGRVFVAESVEKTTNEGETP